MHQRHARRSGTVDLTVLLTRLLLSAGLTVGLGAGLPGATAASAGDPAPLSSAGR